MQGPVSWSDASQWLREGLDLRGAALRGADLRGVDLRGDYPAGLPLTRLRAGLTTTEWRAATPKQREAGAVHLEGATLVEAHLELARLRVARCAGADLRRVWLQGAGAPGIGVHGTDLRRASLEGTDLSEARLDGGASPPTTWRPCAASGRRSLPACRRPTCAARSSTRTARYARPRWATRGTGGAVSPTCAGTASISPPRPGSRSPRWETNGPRATAGTGAGSARVAGRARTSSATRTAPTVSSPPPAANSACVPWKPASPTGPRCWSAAPRAIGAGGCAGWGDSCLTRRRATATARCAASALICSWSGRSPPPTTCWATASRCLWTRSVRSCLASPYSMGEASHLERMCRSTIR